MLNFFSYVEHWTKLMKHVYQPRDRTVAFDEKHKKAQVHYEETE